MVRWRETGFEAGPPLLLADPSRHKRSPGLLDLTLPGIEGSSIYKQVRAKNRTAVIFVMGDASGVDEVRSLEAGVDDYLPKRFSPEVLLARVQAHLRSRRAAGHQRILQYGDLWLDAKNYATRVKGDWVDLRPQPQGPSTRETKI